MQPPGSITARRHTVLTLQVKCCLVMDIAPRESLEPQGAIAETRCRELSLPQGHVSYHSVTAFFPHKPMRCTTRSLPGCPASQYSSQKALPTQEPLTAAPALLMALLTPAGTPRQPNTCHRRGFGKEAASNHSCGWDVVSILSPSSLLLLPRLDQTTTRIGATQLLLQEVQQHQQKHQLGLAVLDPAAGCWAARNPPTTPTFYGQSKFGYDLPEVRTTGPKPPNSRASFQNDSEPTQLLPSPQRQQCSSSSRACIPMAHRLHLPAVHSAPAAVLEGAHPSFLASPPHNPAGLRVLQWGLTTP